MDQKPASLPHEHAPATIAVTAGRPPRVPGADPNVPVHLSSTFVAHGDLAYGRFGNPTWHALETAIGELEGGRTLVFGAGMGAIGAALRLIPEDGTLVAPDQVYSGTEEMFARLAATGTTVVRCAAADTAGITAALRSADVLWCESPTNPLMEVMDLAAILPAARAGGVLSIVDNTVATPLGCRPLELGADVVAHSVTKYLAGHSDVLMGALVVGSGESADALFERLRKERTLGGSVPGPLEAFLALRGLRTFPLRFERASANAARLAERLAGHPAVSRLRYPGSGAMLAIEIAGGADAAELVCGSTGLWLDSTSLGGVESQLERRRRHPNEPPTVPENLVRLSVGIENVEDLWSDLAQALDRTVEDLTVSRARP